MDSSKPEASEKGARWIILVAADQRELYEHLREIFHCDKLVKVVLDRRRDPSRSPEWLIKTLRERGAVVIPRQARRTDDS